MHKQIDSIKSFHRGERENVPDSEFSGMFFVHNKYRS